jgi:hypothetical protein
MPLPSANQMRSAPSQTSINTSTANPAAFADDIYDAYIAAAQWPAGSGNDIERGGFVNILKVLADHGGSSRFMGTETLEACGANGVPIPSGATVQECLDAMCSVRGHELTLQQLTRALANTIATVLDDQRYTPHWWNKWLSGSTVPKCLGFSAGDYVDNNLAPTPQQARAIKRARAAALRPRGPVETEVDPELYAARLEGDSGHGGSPHILASTI